MQQMELSPADVLFLKRMGVSPKARTDRWERLAKLSVPFAAVGWMLAAVGWGLLFHFWMVQ